MNLGILVHMVWIKRWASASSLWQRRDNKGPFQNC